MASYNKVILVGNVTREIEVKFLASGTAVADVGLAVNDKRKGTNGEWIEETTFVDCTLWGKTAEIAGEYAHKGSSILIEGRLKMESWEDKTTGQKRTKLKVNGERMQLLGGKGGGGSRGTGATREDDEYSEPLQPRRHSNDGPPDDDIPFAFLLPFFLAAASMGSFLI